MRSIYESVNEIQRLAIGRTPATNRPAANLAFMLCFIR